MAWENIHEDDYGWTGRLRIVQDAVVQDISSFTTRQFVFRSQDGTITTKTATFATDGTDGVLQYTMESGVITEPGRWTVQARVAKTGAELTSEQLRFTVDRRIDA